MKGFVQYMVRLVHGLKVELRFDPNVPAEDQWGIRVVGTEPEFHTLTEVPQWRSVREFVRNELDKQLQMAETRCPYCGIKPYIPQDTGDGWPSCANCGGN